MSGLNRICTGKKTWKTQHNYTTTDTEHVSHEMVLNTFSGEKHETPAAAHYNISNKIAS